MDRFKYRGSGISMSAVNRLAAFTLFGLLAYSTTACTKVKKTGREPISPAPAINLPTDKGNDKATSGAAVAAPPAIAQPDTCIAYGKLPGEPPQPIPAAGVVLTRVMKPCVTRDGLKGYHRDSPWMAMGFPCTGTEGRIDWKGTNYLNPKMVSFIVSTDCGMFPTSSKEVAATISTAFELPATAPLLAYNPFVVQYWEVPAIQEADTGFVVDLRTDEAVRKVWPKLVKNEPLPVRLVGRENAWVAGDHLYLVEADIFVTQKNRFKLKVKSITVLNTEAKEEVKARCEALRPRRNCLQVF